jgi:Eukaryotic aspartyl protease
MGMGFQSISNLNAPPVFQTLLDEDVVHCPMFAFKFSTTPNESALSLGGVDPDLYTGDFTWVSLTHKVCPIAVTASLERGC